MSEQPEISVVEFLNRLDAGWAELQAFIASLSPQQLTVPADAVGWTVKDHLMHIVAWQDGINALLEGEDRRERMGVDEATWQRRDFDAINAVIQKQHRHRTADDVLQMLRRTHAAFRAHVAAMIDADLQRPYSDFAPTSDNTRPIVGWLEGDGFGHYAEHLPWMRAIVDTAQASASAD